MDKKLDLNYLDKLIDRFEECKIKEFMNLFYCISWRLKDSAEYLNTNSDFPKTNAELIVYLYHCFQIYNGIKTTYECLLKDKGFASLTLNFFKVVFEMKKENIDVNDDIFFEYFRSIAFIHPFKTSWRSGRNFMQQGETHTSNWFDADHNTFFVKWPKDFIFVNCYSDKNDESCHWVIPFSSIQNFIFNKWEKLNLITDEMIKKINEQYIKWKQVKCDRSIKDKVEAFVEIRNILTSRSIEDTYEIDRIIFYFSTNLTVASNKDSVDEFLNDIWDSIDSIRDCVDNLDHEKLINILRRFVGVTPKHTHKTFLYEMEKTHTYLKIEKQDPLLLNEERKMLIDENEKWGKLQAKNFSNGFAKKYVTILPDKMENKEILLLIDTACYLEAKRNGYFM